MAPRSLLRDQVDAARALGFSAFAASELEYYVFEQDYRVAAESEYRNLKPAGWYLEDYHILQGTRTEPYTAAVRRHLKASGIPVENSKGEWGLGQHELNVRYTDALQMADRHVIFKQCLKEVAEASGRSVTFMAKFAADRAGSSCHVHLSLWREGQNAFAGDTQFGPVKCSDTFRWFLGGWIARVPDVMVFYAPTVNSYKRYVDASWAPTRLAWSYDNRTAGFRVVGHGPSPADRMPDARRGLQPVSRVCRRPRLWPRWHPQSHRAAGVLHRRHVRGSPSATRRRRALRDATDDIRGERVRQARLSAAMWSSTTPTSSGPSSAAYDQSRHRLGAPPVFRTHMTMSTRLEGKVALITGAGSGIGRNRRCCSRRRRGGRGR